MAEFITKYECKKNNIDVYVESMATSNEETGNDMYYLAKDILDKYKIPYTKREAHRLSKSDYDRFDLIIGMDEANIYNILRTVEKDDEGKVFKLLVFTGDTSDISDPWYTRDFEKAYQDIYKGVLGLINYLKNEK